MGAPWWDPDARGAIYGLTRDTGKAHIVRATLEAAAYQTVDLLDALGRDWTGGVSEIRVDGGMANNNWLMQFLSDVTQTPVTRPAYTETTALGAALLAGLGAGVWQNLDDIAAKWSADSHFSPSLSNDESSALMAEWHDAVRRTLNETENE
jgi:glycerol kinase